MPKSNLITTKTGETLYPEPRFRDWEMRRRIHSEVLGSMVCGYVEQQTVGIGQPTILDVAAGEGYTAQLLEDAGFAHQIVSTDLDSDALSLDRWLPKDEEAPRVVSNLRHLPFRPESIDLITSISGYTSIVEKQQDIARQIADVLRVGGTMLVTNDTRRGVGRLMTKLFRPPSPKSQPMFSISFDGLDNIYQPAFVSPNPSNTVFTFANDGEISVPVMVDTGAMNKALVTVTTEVGMHPVNLADYNELTDHAESEALYAPIFAKAAALLLKKDRAKRLLPGQGPKESWNSFFYLHIKEELSRVFGAVRIEDRHRIVQLEPRAVTDRDGAVFYPGIVQRDTIGNIYYADLAKEPQAATLDFRAKFLLAKK